MAADSDIVVILAALLCALICVVGLALVARCAWHRRSRGPASPVLQKKGVKKKLLRSLPSISFRSGVTDPKFADCAICLAEFVEGDEIRVLPPCGHGFHQSCVDAWLTSHSSCPSCRQVLVAPPAQCENCGVASASTTNAPPVGAPAESASQQYGASGSKAREEGDGHRYLP